MLPTVTVLTESINSSAAGRSWSSVLDTSPSQEASVLRLLVHTRQAKEKITTARRDNMLMERPSKVKKAPLFFHQTSPDIRKLD